MVIKISKGEVTLKESLTNRDLYNFQCAENSAMKLTQEGASLDGDAVNKLKEFKALAVIEKIVIDEKEKDVSIDTLLNDEFMTYQDFDKVFNGALEHAGKIQNKALPSKKSLPTLKK